MYLWEDYMKENKNVHEITIKVEGTEWEKAKDSAYQKASKKVKIDGFRPGKAPKEVFLKKYGEENLWLDAADLVLEDAYKKMIDENQNLIIVAQPQASLKSISADYVEFLFILTTKPEVKLGNYKKLGVKKEETKVTKEEVEQALESTRKRYAESVSKEGPVAEGNTAIIDFEGFKDGVAFEGGKGENYSLEIGSGTFIPGFEEQLIGMKKGEEKDIHVTFPADYHAEDLKGQPVIFKVKVNEIKETKLPEFDKDFFEDLGMDGIDTKEALEHQLEENIQTHKEHHAEEHFMDEILDKAIANMEVDIPDAMTEEELNRIVRQYEQNLNMQGITLEQFYQFTNSDEAALKDQMREEAVKRVSSRLLLEEIVKAEKLEATEEETAKEADVLAEKYSMKKEEFLKEFGGLDMVKYDLEMHRALEFLKNNN